MYVFDSATPLWYIFLNIPPVPLSNIERLKNVTLPGVYFSDRPTLRFDEHFKEPIVLLYLWPAIVFTENLTWMGTITWSYLHIYTVFQSLIISMLTYAFQPRNSVWSAIRSKSEYFFIK